VTFLVSGAIRVSELSDEPLWTTVYGSGSSAGNAAWLKVVEAARAPVTAAANKWTKVGENALQTVELRAIGAGLFDWNKVDIAMPLGYNNALPPEWRAKGKGKAAAAVASAAAVAAEDEGDFEQPMASAAESPAAACVREFVAWREVRKKNLSAFYLPDSAPGSPPETSVFMCNYWLKVRASPAFSRVGRVMLWWLSFPPGATDLERQFLRPHHDHARLPPQPPGRGNAARERDGPLPQAPHRGRAGQRGARGGGGARLDTLTRGGAQRRRAQERA